MLALTLAFSPGSGRSTCSGLWRRLCCYLRDMRETRVEEIFLTEMEQFGAQLLRNRRMIVDHQANVSAPGDGKNRLRDASDFANWNLLGAQLNKIRSSVTKRLCHGFRSPAM